MIRPRIVPVEGLPPDPINREAAHAALDRALNAGAVVLTILYETPDEYDWESLPRSHAVAEGLMINCLNNVRELKGGEDE
jgi:hypothetical protein